MNYDPKEAFATCLIMAAIVVLMIIAILAAVTS